MNLPGLLLTLLLPTGPFGPEERPIWQQRLRWPETYERNWQSSWEPNQPDTAGLRIYALNASLYLIQVETYHHAETPRQIYYLYNQVSTSGSPLTLAWLSRPRGQSLQAHQALELTGQPSFSQSDKTLSLIQPEGCGQLIRWRFINGRPMLKEVRRRDCANQTTIAPDNWLRRWP